MIKTQDFYFGIREDEDNTLEVALVPKTYWDKEKCLSDKYYEPLQSFLPEFFGEEDCENTWYLEDKDIDTVKLEMEKVGFEYSADVSAFLKECNDEYD